MLFVGDQVLHHCSQTQSQCQKRQSFLLPISMQQPMVWLVPGGISQWQKVIRVAWELWSVKEVTRNRSHAYLCLAQVNLGKLSTKPHHQLLLRCPFLQISSFFSSLPQRVLAIYARSSDIAPRNTNSADRRKRAASAKPTRISGQPEWVSHTPTAANNTDTFAIMWLREHNQTELMFMSSARR